MAGVDEFDIEVFLIAIIAFEQKAVGQPVTEGFIAVVQIVSRERGKLADDAGNFGFGEAILLLATTQVMPKVCFDQHLCFVGAGQFFTGQIVITLLTE